MTLKDLRTLRFTPPPYKIIEIYPDTTIAKSRTFQGSLK